MKKIPIVNPQLFVKNYFDHDLMEEDSFNINSIIPQEQTCFFYISPVENANKYIKFPKEHIKTNYYELIFLTEGYCIGSDNLNEIKQNKNEIRFVAPGKITSIIDLSENAKGYYCFFDKAFIDTYTGTINLLDTLSYFELDARPVINLTDNQTSFFSTILRKIEEDYFSNYTKHKSNISSYLVAILKDCSTIYEKVFQNSNNLTSANRITEEFLRLVNKHYLTKRQLSDYAELLRVTPKHLTKSVKKTTGQPPMTFIYKMLTLEAKILLKDTKQSVAEIAYQLSFEDAAYFNRFFKQHAGVTPNNFRNNS